MFTARFRVFRILGFDIYLDLSWFLIAFLIAWSLATALFPATYPGFDPGTYWLMGIVGALALFGSLLLHELGHAVAARRVGLQIRGITLFLFGGVAEMSEEPRSAKAEFQVAIAGPIVSIVIAAACYGLSRVGVSLGWSPPVVGVLWYLGWINAIVVVFNMVPAFPLDGGRVLRSILWAAKGNLRWATRITTALGSGFGIFLMVLGVVNFVGGNIIGGMWQFVLGLFLKGAAQMSYQQVLVRKALEGEAVGRLMQTNVDTVPSTMTIDDLVEQYIYRRHHKMFPVVDDGILRGCVTIRGIKDIPREERARRTVGEIVESCGTDNTISAHADAMKALAEMNQRGQSRLMVVDGQELLGVVTLKDVMRFISLKLELDDDTSPSTPLATATPAAPAKKRREEEEFSNV